jgi:hypothetical protein
LSKLADNQQFDEICIIQIKYSIQKHPSKNQKVSNNLIIKSKSWFFQLIFIEHKSQPSNPYYLLQTDFSKSEKSRQKFRNHHWDIEVYPILILLKDVFINRLKSCYSESKSFLKKSLMSWSIRLDELLDTLWRMSWYALAHSNFRQGVQTCVSRRVMLFEFK